MRRSLPRVAAATLLFVSTLTTAADGALAPSDNARLKALDGVYEVIADDDTALGRWRNAGSPARITATSRTSAAVTGVMQGLDPDKLCQAVGPFRMMARPKLRIELVAAPDRLVMLFEDVAHGYLRSLYIHRTHPNPAVPRFAFQGDSIAHWEAGVLVVDTIGFNDRTWLNEHVKASDALHLTERLRLLANGRILEYRMRASDPAALSIPYSYTRYFRRTESSIQQDVCEPDSHWSPEQGF